MQINPQGGLQNYSVTLVDDDDSDSDDIMDTVVDAATCRQKRGDESYDKFMPFGMSEETCNMVALRAELESAVPAFWIRRTVRRRALRKLAQDCVVHRNRVYRKAAKLRHDAARQRLEMLRRGDAAGHAAMLAGSRGLQEERLKAILNETERILKELGAPLCDVGEELNQPPCMEGKMMKHQLQGMSWLVRLVENQASGILADEMGLGKTVQAIAFLAYLRDTLGENGPHLIVAPAALIAHWKDEVSGWLKGVVCDQIIGSKANVATVLRRVAFSLDKSFNIVLTTFEQVVRNHKEIATIPWFCTIVDEGHRLKNHRGRFSETCKLINSRHRILLSGTPIQNSLRELWSMLSFVAPHAFSSLDDFEQWFALPAPPCMKFKSACKNEVEYVDDDGDGDGGNVARVPAVAEEGGLLSEEEELLVIQRLHTVLRPFILRRTKEMVDASLPSKREEVIWVPLTAWQRHLYHKCLQGMGNKDLGGFLKLRQALSHPYLFLPRPLSEQEICSRPENLFRASGKFELIDRIVPRLVQSGHKVLIFAQFTLLLELLGDLLRRRGVVFDIIEGKTTMLQRRKIVHSFQQAPELQVLLLSVKAAGLGMNLQAADTVIMFDSDWNPQVDLQAMARAHRIGQKREVVILRLMTPSNLDVHLLRRTGRKLEIEKKVISAGEFHEKSWKSVPSQKFGGSRESLLKDLVREARENPSVAAHAVVAATPLREVNRLIARSEKERVMWDDADKALLGAEAAGKGGTVETIVERLERCGRFIKASEFPRARKAVGKTRLRTSSTRSRIAVQKKRRLTK